MKIKYFKINLTKEQKDIKILIELLKPYITENTIIVNCSPDYSSIISQKVIHAYYDNPLEMINFNMPFPNTGFEKEYPEYCKDFVKTLDFNKMHIFIDSGVLRGKNFKTLKDTLNLYNSTFWTIKLSFIFASLYVQDNSIFTPDVYVEKFNKTNQGMLLFYWENKNCTLFD